MGRLKKILEEKKYTKEDLLNILNQCKTKKDFYNYFNLACGPSDKKDLEELCEKLNFDINNLARKPRLCLTCGKVLKKGQKKFCSRSCAATYNNKKRRIKPLQIPKDLPKYKNLIKEQLEDLLLNKNLSFNYIGRLYNTGYRVIQRLAKNFNIDLSNYKPNHVRKYSDELRKCLNCGKKVKHNSNVFCSIECCNEYKKKQKYKNYLEHQEDFVGKEISYEWLKPIILKEQNYECAIEGCTCKTEWNDKPLVFVLDHIDGNACNNKRDNLRLVCPNCDSQLDTYKAKNIGKSTRKYKPYVDGKLQK